MDVTDSNNRDAALDFVKGILVIVMVIYHVMNYFSTAGSAGFGYVRFVTGSFIFVSGYIISRFYEKKYRIDRSGTSRRLFARGVKLLIIFTALNVFINLTAIGNPGKAPLGMRQYLGNLSAIYVSGNGRLAAFQILLPISYLLLLSPALLFLDGFKKSMIVTTLLVAFCFSWFHVDSDNLSLGLVGVLGLSAGMAINELQGSFSIKNRLIIVSCLLVCIYLMGYLSRNVIAYSIGVGIVLKLFYDLAKTVNLRKQINQRIILFGQYTLICYIMQIALLQGLFRILSGKRWGLGYETVSVFIVTNIVLLGLCRLVKFLRDRYESADKTYRFIFS
jgi:peptidoglycan/LPS O-acetylase OafA/YrhL